MKITFKGLASFVATFCVLSFVGLVLAIGTDFWYIIDTSKRENSSSLSLSSHSGLWRTCNFNNRCSPFMNPFGAGRNLSDSQRQILTLLSLAGICVYMAHSQAAFKEAVGISGHKSLEDIEIYFGWSLVLASVSFVGQLCTAMAFLLASARVSQLTNQEEDE
ncbi:transmembrane protein [Pimephales promelas]|nr:transmembrane protein [Pimephales promelas]